MKGLSQIAGLSWLYVYTKVKPKAKCYGDGQAR